MNTIDHGMNGITLTFLRDIVDDKRVSLSCGGKEVELTARQAATLVHHICSYLREDETSDAAADAALPREKAIAVLQMTAREAIDAYRQLPREQKHINHKIGRLMAALQRLDLINDGLDPNEELE